MLNQQILLHVIISNPPWHKAAGKNSGNSKKGEVPRNVFPVVLQRRPGAENDLLGGVCISIGGFLKILNWRDGSLLKLTEGSLWP